MSLYERIVCPVDFSNASRAALEWALGLGTRTTRPIVVLHVLDTGLLSVGNLVAVPGAADELKKRAEAVLAEWKREIDLSSADVRFVEGSPVETIAASVEESHAGLLVLGTHGLTGFQKLLLGSVTEKLLHRVKVPVLMLRREDSGDGGFEPPRRVLAAIDFGPESGEVFRHASWWAQRFSAELVLAHAVPVPYVVLNERTLERLSPQQFAEIEEHLVEGRREELASLAAERPGTAHESIVRVGSPFDVLRSLIGERDADLVVLGAGGHGEGGLGWLGSTCHKLVRAVSCPVLVVR